MSLEDLIHHSAAIERLSKVDVYVNLCGKWYRAIEVRKAMEKVGKA